MCVWWNGIKALRPTLGSAADKGTEMVFCQRLTGCVDSSSTAPRCFQVLWPDYTQGNKPKLRLPRLQEYKERTIPMWLEVDGLGLPCH